LGWGDCHDHLSCQCHKAERIPVNSVAPAELSGDHQDDGNQLDGKLVECEAHTLISPADGRAEVIYRRSQGDLKKVGGLADWVEHRWVLCRDHSS